MAKIKLSIVIPAYNEGFILQKNLEILIENFPETEIILSDDGSSDNTERIARKLSKNIKYLKSTENKGKGHAIKKGMLEANGDYAIFTDADLPFGTEGIKNLVGSLTSQKKKIAIAEKENYKKGFFYLFVRNITGKIVSLMFGFNFKDTQAGLKGFSAETKERIFRNTFINRFACDVEMLFLAKKDGLEVITVPLEIRSGSKRLSHFKFKEGLFFMSDVFKIRFHRYKDANIPLCKDLEEI